MSLPHDPIRILTAVPICDGHDSAINTINLELIRAGIEVIYLGYHRSVRDIVRAAVQEDVRGVGISSYNGGHVEFFAEVVKQLRKQAAGDIAVFGGGGGTITEADAAIMRRRGVDRVFMAGTPLSEIVKYVRTRFHRPVRHKTAKVGSDQWVSAMLRKGKQLTPSPGTRGEGVRGQRAEGRGQKSKALSPTLSRSTGRGRPPLTIGVTGPGGAGKTTLIDELVVRFLRLRDDLRIAVLSHDPSIVAGGALLGDRATMVYSQHDRVFMRSLATRGQSGGLSLETAPALSVLQSLPFDVIFVETVGTGQEAMPFTDGAVDHLLFVMSPEYGSQLQLQKIAMLDLADVIVVNKSDLAGAPRAASEVQQRIDSNNRAQRVIDTIAKNHRDTGIEKLFNLLAATGDDRDGNAGTSL